MNNRAQRTDMRMVGNELPRGYTHREILRGGDGLTVGVAMAITVAVAVAAVQCPGGVCNVAVCTNDITESRQTGHGDS